MTIACSQFLVPNGKQGLSITFYGAVKLLRRQYNKHGKPANSDKCVFFPFSCSVRANSFHTPTVVSSGVELQSTLLLGRKSRGPLPQLVALTDEEV